MKAQHIGIPGTLRVVACCSGVWAVTVLARRMTTMLLLEVSLPMNRENERKMQPCHDMIKFTDILKSSHVSVNIPIGEAARGVAGL